MKRYTPTLEAYSWASLDDHDTHVYAVMGEDPNGDWVRIEEASPAQLTAALRDLHSAVDDAMCVSVAGKGNSQKAKLTRAMRRALAALEQPEPGTPILTTDCPCCGAELEIEHGDEPGDIGVVGTPADGGND